MEANNYCPNCDNGVAVLISGITGDKFCRNCGHRWNDKKIKTLLGHEIIFSSPMARYLFEKEFRYLH